MANIRSYLIELEARLAPSLDSGSLQERLTEAENHLRDRAQEFEEIGLPTMEAEARAVAAFGGPEEYVVDIPARPLSAPPKPIKEARQRDIALQLAWSAMGLGLISMITFSYGGLSAGLAAGFIVFLGALFSRATSLWRLALLSAVTSVALFPILMFAYVPTPFDSRRGENTGARLRNEPSWQSFAHQAMIEEKSNYDRYRKMFQTGQLPRNAEGKALGPIMDARNTGMYYGHGYGYGGWSSLQEYDSPDKAAAMWRQEGEVVAQRLKKAVVEMAPATLVLTQSETASRFAALSVVAGFLLMAFLTGAQAIGMALRSAGGWIFSRRPSIPPMVGHWESPRN